MFTRLQLDPSDRCQHLFQEAVPQVETDANGLGTVVGDDLAQDAEVGRLATKVVDIVWLQDIGRFGQESEGSHRFDVQWPCLFEREYVVTKDFVELFGNIEQSRLACAGGVFIGAKDHFAIDQG